MGVTAIDVLIHDANRPGRIGREALAVLQDAALERYGAEFAQAADHASGMESIRNVEYVLAFNPIGYEVGVMGDDRESLKMWNGLQQVPPFAIATPEHLTWRPPHAGIVLWSTRTAFDTAGHQERWRAAWRRRLAAQRARPEVVLNVERIRLDRGGYDASGRYYGGGPPLFRVTSDAPLPADVEPRTTGRLGYVAGGGYWIDTVVRAPSAREARRIVAAEFGVRPRTRARPTQASP